MPGARVRCQVPGCQRCLVHGACGVVQAPGAWTRRPEPGARSLEPEANEERMKDSELRAALDEIRSALGELAARVSRLEAGVEAPAVSPPAVEAPAIPPPSPVEAPGEIVGEDLVLVITAAIAAFLGERAHVRQIRLISSSAWAQQGRVSVQASHRLAR